MKDLFSKGSDQYASFRPTYPTALFEYIAGLCANTEIAWDCGTGNGQVARILTAFFDEVHATDISQNQLDNAYRHPKIQYSQQSAEKTDFSENHFDLTVVAQAIHWINFEKFYREVNRCSKNCGLILVLGYGLVKISPEIDKVIHKLYREILDKYWEPERKYIDEKYRSIPFPFEELEVPNFPNEHFWSFEQVWGYLNTWSAVKKYISVNQQNPLEIIESDFKKAWGEGSRKIEFPLLVRLGTISNL